MSASENNIKKMSDLCEEIKVKIDYFSSALVKLAILKEDSKQWLHSAVITFLKSDETMGDEIRDYGKLLLIKKILDPASICEILKELVENKRFMIEGLPVFPIEGSFQGLTIAPSKKQLGYLSSDWPTRYTEFMLGGSVPSLPHGILIKLNLPSYPNAAKAIFDFFNLKEENIDRRIFIQISDYRVRITNLSIHRNKVKLEIDSKIKTDDLIAKFYGEISAGPFGGRGFKVMHSPDLIFKGNLVEYVFDREPDYILASVLDITTGENIDYREYHYGWSIQEGITIERDEMDIREIIRRGENITTEFKQDLNNTEDFLETIVSFANTKGGFIFIGVSDDARFIGFKANMGQIDDLIFSNIEPKPTINKSVVEIDGKPITLVEVNEGDNKPYSHRQLGFYVRSGATDRRATRTDLDEIYSTKGTPYPK